MGRPIIHGGSRVGFDRAAAMLRSLNEPEPKPEPAQPVKDHGFEVRDDTSMLKPRLGKRS